MVLDPKLSRALEAIVGRGGLSDDPADQLAYSRDLWPKALLWLRSGRHTVHPPQAVVWPRSADEVSAVVQELARAGVPVIPFGAGSGVCGGTLPLRGGVVMDLKRLSRIRGVLANERLVDVEAGVIGEDLEQALARRGWTLGHFPSSMYCSSVGGWLATRSAGQMSTLYGKIEDMVSELGCVTSDGAYHRVRGRPSRGQGPGFCPLLLGSEGFYAVLTDARLRIHPAPEARRFRALRFSRLTGGMEGVRRLMQAGLRPAVVRLYDAPDSLLLRAGSVEKGEPGTSRLRGLARGALHHLREQATHALLERPGLANLAIDRVPDAAFGGCLLVLVFEGLAGVVEAEEAAALDLLADHATDLGPELARTWYDHRYAISYRQSPVFASGAFNDTMEVAATWNRLGDVYAAVRKALARKVLVLAHFSHAYHEGCSIYFTFVGAASDDAAAVELYDETWRTALAAVTEAGGVISHHHGVGVSKVAAMEGEYGAALQIAWALKRTFDPAGVLNPGKLLSGRGRIEVEAPSAAPRSRPPASAEAVQEALEGAVPGGVTAVADPPMFTVTPGDANEVAACLRIATRFGVPVVAHSQAAGGRAAAAGVEMTVSLERMQAVREVSEKALVAHVEAGLRVRSLEEKLSEHALTLGYALLPDVHPKVGGLLGGFGWGESGAAGGAIHDACIGLEAVLPRGEPVRVKPAPRRAAGPDLMQALLGGEGAFGIITAAYVRVQRVPRVRRIVGAWVPDAGAGIGAVAGLLADSIRPAFARVVRPGPGWATTPMRGEAAALLVFEGGAALVECFAEIARERLRAAGGDEIPADDPLAARGPVDLPGDEDCVLERVEAAGLWSELTAFDREAATLLGDDLVSCRFTNALPEGGTACWTVCAPAGRSAGDRRSSVRLVERLADRGLALAAYRGVRPLPPRLVRRVHGRLRPWMEALKRELDPAGICNPGALGLP